jgi:hypothetical protein
MSDYHVSNQPWQKLEKEEKRAWYRPMNNFRLQIVAITLRRDVQQRILEGYLSAGPYMTTVRSSRDED